MLEILGAAGDALVGDNVLEPHEGENVDHLGRVEEGVDIDVADAPRDPERDLTFQERDQAHVVVGVVDHRSEVECRLPGPAPADHVDVGPGGDDPPDDQRATSEDGMIGRREAIARQRGEEVPAAFVGLGPAEVVQCSGSRDCCSTAMAWIASIKSSARLLVS